MSVIESFWAGDLTLRVCAVLVCVRCYDKAPWGRGAPLGQEPHAVLEAAPVKARTLADLVSSGAGRLPGP